MKIALKVMLCDGSALVALGADRLLEAALQWNVKLAATDLVYEHDLKGVEGFGTRKPLRVEALEPEVLERALVLYRLYPQLSLMDSSTLALAARRSWLVLTQSSIVESVAAQLAVPCRGVEWLRAETQRRQAAMPHAAAAGRQLRIREEKAAFTCAA